MTPITLRKLLYTGTLAVFVCAIQSQALAQRKGRRNNMPVANEQKNMTPKLAMPAATRNEGPKPYKDVITAKAVSYKSFVQVHKLDDKYFLEIPDALLGREMLAINRIAAAPADFRNSRTSIGYAGDIIGQLVFHFAKAEGNRLFLKVKNYKERALDTSLNGLARSLDRNNMEAIMSSFPVKAVNDSVHSSVIEITELLAQDNLLFGFAANVKTATGLTGIIADRSYLGPVKADTAGVSFSFMRTYNKTSGGLGGTQAPFSFELRSGIMLLPAVPMAPRTADKRVGFQSVAYIDFDENPLGVANKGTICRWRLEPQDSVAYRAGKLSDPMKPIRMFMDPVMPGKWKPFVTAGIESWNKAFEQAGFRNAIQVVAGNRTDSASYLDDLSYSAVVFMPGDGSNTGNVIVDPRSGEILQVQLNLYLGTFDKLYRKYFIQAGAIDKTANRPTFPDSLMGKLVQAYVMQAMGELLGLKNNTGAAFNNNNSDLKSERWLKDHAFNGSATSPILVNYVVQPEDKVKATYLLPGITEADCWTINWGYRIISGNEQPALNSWIVTRTNSGQETYIAETPDARNLPGSIGNDVISSAAYGISNLKRIVPHLLEWTREPATGDEAAGRMYEALLDQYTTYGRYAVKQLGGIYINNRNSSQTGDVFTLVPLAAQKKAVAFLQQYFFDTPEWLRNKELYGRTGQCFDSVMNVQRLLLAETLNKQVMDRLQNMAHNYPGTAYQPLNFLQDLGNGIFREIRNNQPVAIPVRELQRTCVSQLLTLLEIYAQADNDLPAILRTYTGSLLQLLQQKQSAYTGITKAHISHLANKLRKALYPADITSQSAGRN